MQEKKSIFVDVLGWIMIVLSSGALIISIGQNIMVNFIFPVNIYDSLSQIGGNPENSPGHFFQNIRIIIAVIGLIILYSLIISIAFLKRKEWGRIGLILLYGLLIMYNVASLVMQWTFINTVESESPPIDSDFGKITTTIKIFMAILVIGLSVLLGWLMKKLISKKVIAEFRPNTETNEQPVTVDLNETVNENSNKNDNGPQIFFNEGVG